MKIGRLGVSSVVGRMLYRVSATGAVPPLCRPCGHGLVDREGLSESQGVGVRVGVLWLFAR